MRFAPLAGAAVLLLSGSRAGAAPAPTARTPGEATALVLTVTRQPEHDRSSGETRVDLLSRRDDAVLRSFALEGRWHCLGYAPERGAYVLGGELEVGALLPLAGIGYVEEKTSSWRVSAAAPPGWYAFAAVARPDLRYVAFLGERTLWVLDTKHDVMKAAGRSPHPPPQTEGYCIAAIEDSGRAREWTWGDICADGYVVLDDGVVAFAPRAALEVRTGNDTYLRRSGNRKLETIHLDELFGEEATTAPGEAVHGEGEGAMSDACLLSLEIRRSASPWGELGGAARESPAANHVAAVALDPAYDVPEHLRAFAVHGEELLGIDRAKQRIVVNGKFFGDLERADATRLAPGARARLGFAKDLGSSGLSPRQIARFLLESQLIETYWHVEARLCLLREEDTPELYRAHFTGRHVYYTNSRHEHVLVFAVLVDKKTGELSVAGE